MPYMVTKSATYRMPVALLKRMAAQVKLTGVRPSEQVRRSVGAWLDTLEREQRIAANLAKGAR